MKTIRVETCLSQGEITDKWTWCWIAKGSAVDRALHGEEGELSDWLRTIYRKAQ